MTHLTAADFLAFRRQLEQIGIDDATIAEAIRLGGNRLPVFAGQVRGCYLRADGTRPLMFAVPGWYAIEHIGPVVSPKRGPMLRIRSKPTADPFACSSFDIRHGLDVNLACVADGLQP